MLELENRTEAVLEAVGDRGEVLALAHGQDNDYNLSVAIVRAGGDCERQEFLVWIIRHNTADGSSMLYKRLMLVRAGLGWHDRMEALRMAWGEFNRQASRIGYWPPAEKK